MFWRDRWPQGEPVSVNKLAWLLSCIGAILVSMDSRLVVNESHRNPEEKFYMLVVVSEGVGSSKACHVQLIELCRGVLCSVSICVVSHYLGIYIHTLFLFHMFESESDWLQKIFSKD